MLSARGKIKLLIIIYDYICIYEEPHPIIKNNVYDATSQNNLGIKPDGC